MLDKDAPKILEVKNLKQYFNVGRKDEVRAVDDITFNVHEGETFGLVGESGSGKTTTGRAISHLYEPTGGEIIFEGKDVSKLKTKKMKKNSEVISKLSSKTLTHH
ncbi:hypothetical protein AKUG0410_11560 [Apilactobacillus kunkeei]|nr:hypothetical protein AKUG0412_11560 [Apilactobacillus kunkeei]CAI2688339.1 hypothetical protein AKUG0410_11560 [Apilactobacillus kunkeei]